LDDAIGLSVGWVTWKWLVRRTGCTSAHRVAPQADINIHRCRARVSLTAYKGRTDPQAARFYERGEGWRCRASSTRSIGKPSRPILSGALRVLPRPTGCSRSSPPYLFRLRNTLLYGVRPERDKCGIYSLVMPWQCGKEKASNLLGKMKRLSAE
jgi:hypothetical protein